jgi:aminoglycoside phosphotransferase (APT) family kinase protein
MGFDPTNLLEEALPPVLGSPVIISGLRPLTSGASRQSFGFEAAPDGQAEGSRPYVLQVAVGRGTAPTGAVGSGPLSMKTQAAVMQAALAAGVPVAPILVAGDYDGREYIVADWMDGEALPPKMLRDPQLADGRARLMDDCARALATIHRLPPDGLGLVEVDRLAMYRTTLDGIEPRPVLELGYRWLMEHRPQAGPLTVVHGDFRLGNLLVGKEGLQAVLDWEIAHLGDPHEDVGWATIRAWRFDRHRQPGTFPEPEEWARAYAAAAGSDSGFDPNAMRWWQIAGTWSWAVISAMQARRHLDGWMQSLEHAVIGRRVCESEWDLLELLP